MGKWNEFEAAWERRRREAKPVPKISPPQLLAALELLERTYAVAGATPLSAAARFIRGLDLIENGRWRRSAFVPLADDAALLTLIREYEIEEGSRHMAVARYAAEDGTPGGDLRGGCQAADGAPRPARAVDRRQNSWRKTPRINPITRRQKRSNPDLAR